MARIFPALAMSMVFLLSACNFTQPAPPTPAAQPPTTQPAAPTVAPAAPVAATMAPEPTTAPTSTPAPSPTIAPTSTPAPVAAKYEKAECRFEMPATAKAECGFLTVPEDRSNPGGKTIRLHVAVFKSTADKPAPDPIVYLEGGPGGSPLKTASLVFDSKFATFLDTRDFIMFDQRGTGFSEPALNCPEMIKLQYDTLEQDIRIAEGTRLSTEAMMKCHDRMEKEGVNLAAYTSAANAADLEDLRIALGYKTWNLYGISYGTRLALTTMRDHPQGIRSVILDSSYPLQANLFIDLPVSAERAFTTLFEGCAADQACNQAYPDLKGAFYKLVDKLNEKPIIEPVTNPLNGERHKILLNGDSLISTLFQGMYSTEVIPLLPRVIYNGLEGTDYSLLARIAFLNLAQADFISNGMYYSVQCAEEFPFTSREELIAADQAYPQQHDVFDGESFYTLCSQWGAGSAAPIENQPVQSDIPTLVLAGQYDPVTPPDYNKQVAQSLSKSYLFEFPGLGHGVSISGDCPLGITKAFLETPERQPESDCINAMSGPPFVVPNARIELEPFESSAFGIQSVKPIGWGEVGPGVYAPSGAGDVAILQLALPGSSDASLKLLVQQFKLESTPKSTGQYKSKQFTWKLYQFDVQDHPSDLALAEKNGKTYIVMLISTAADREAMYEKVFKPALDALAPA